MFLSSLITVAPSCSFERGFRKGQQVQQELEQEKVTRERGWSCRAGSLPCPGSLSAMSELQAVSATFPPESCVLPNMKDIYDRDLSPFVFNYSYANPFGGEGVGRPRRKWHVKTHKLVRKTSTPKRSPPTKNICKQITSVCYSRFKMDYL